VADVNDVDQTVGPLEALSAYEHAFGRIDLIDCIARLIRAHDAIPGPAHLAFAKIGFADIITTNFDLLLERAYDAVGKGCLPLLDEVQLSTPNRYAGPRVIKMHGDINHPNRMVITEDDYDQFLEAYPLLATSITAMLIDHTAVLVGYSLDDPDTRQLLSLVKRRLGRLTRPLWAIQVAAPAHIVSRYERRGVKVINLPASRGRTVGDQLERLFLELGQHWREHLPRNSVTTDDRVAADLVLPEEPSRICYFAIPAPLIGWYRDVVFPIVEQHGLIPVTARDVLTPPGTIATKLDALIDRAAVVVIEVGSSWSDYEATLALARKNPAHIFLVAEAGANVRSPGANQRLIMRPAELEADPAAFITEFDAWISESEPFERLDSDAPERLLQLREYEAALISAVSLLEVTLSRWLFAGKVESQRPVSISFMLRRSLELDGFNDPQEVRDIQEAVTRRNEVLHKGRTIGGIDARRYVTAIRVFVNRLR
jgi:hypothetical protein